MQKVNSTTRTLLEIMTSGPYEIPYNQRPYTWGKNNWETLWNSFFSEEEKDVFLGSLIFLIDDKADKPKQIFDGQQRITTLTIMCKALADLFKNNEEIDLATRTRSEFLVDYDGNPKLIVSKTIRDYFQKEIQNTENNPSASQNPIEKEIYKAYTFFYKQFTELLNKKKGDMIALRQDFRQRLMELEVVQLTIRDMLLGIEIFESVNHRGEQLNASQLVKNIIIKHTEEQNDTKNDSKVISLEDVDNRWTIINNKLEETGFSFIDFMHYYWLSRYKYVGKKRLFDAMKKEFKNSSNKWLSFFEDLELSASTFENIYSCKSYESFIIQYKYAEKRPEHYSKYMRYLKCFPFIKNKSWIAPIFSLLDYETKLNKRGKTVLTSKNNPNFLVKIFRKHFIFCFLHFNVFSIPTRDFSPAMYSLATNINNAIKEHPQDHEKSNKKVHDAFKDHFKGYVAKTVVKYFMDDVDFFEGINAIKHHQNNKHLIHTLFGDIEELYFKGTCIDRDKASIEHFMPREAEETWSISKDVSRLHEDRLGNILIVDVELNRKMQNKSHNDKLSLLKENTLTKLNKEFIDEHEKNKNNIYDFSKITETSLSTSDFNNNPSEIDKRTKQVAKYLKEIYITAMKY